MLWVYRVGKSQEATFEGGELGIPKGGQKLAMWTGKGIPEEWAACLLTKAPQKGLSDPMRKPVLLMERLVIAAHTLGP